MGMIDGAQPGFNESYSFQRQHSWTKSVFVTRPVSEVKQKFVSWNAQHFEKLPGIISSPSSWSVQYRSHLTLVKPAEEAKGYHSPRIKYQTQGERKRPGGLRMSGVWFDYSHATTSYHPIAHSKFTPLNE